MLLISPVSSRAADYRPYLEQGSFLRYEHWNTEEKAVTGFSSFLQFFDATRNLWMEQNENYKPDGTAFTRKELIFKENGELQRYREIDLRKQYEVTTTYHGTLAESQVLRDGEARSFQQNLSEGTVPLELILLHLRRLMPELLRSREVRFPIYASMLAIELEEKGFPQSLSQLEMTAEPKKKLNFSAPWGAQEALQVEVYPASWTIRALLPAEKSRFHFVIATSAPYLILVFEEGKTRHTLLEWKQDSSESDQLSPLF